MCVCSVLCVCPVLCSSIDCSPPGSSAHGIFQARILELVAISFSRVSSQLRDQTHVSCVSWTGSWILYHLCHPGSTHYKMAKVQIIDKTKYWQGCGAATFVSCYWWDAKWYNHFGRVSSSLKNETYTYHMIQQSYSLEFTQMSWDLTSAQKPAH